VIRDLTREDWSEWSALWDGYLQFYRAELTEAVSRRTYERLCDQADGMFGLVGTVADGAVVGLAHAIVHPTTWSEAGYCYLEDLFVARESRGSGIARELIEAVVAEARERGAVKVYWHTQEFNAPARSLYDVLATRVSFVVYERAI
jgi:GNAT superfamily N-acetyltransferase